MGIAEYINKFKKIKQNSEFKNIKIAIISNTTVKGFCETLAVICDENGINAEIYETPYGQYYRELMDQNSDLHRLNPNVIFFMMDCQTMLGEHFYNPYGAGSSSLVEKVDQVKAELHQLIEVATNRFDCKIVFNNFMIPTYSPMGIIESKQAVGFFESISHVNYFLNEMAKQLPQVFIFDFNNFASFYGKQNFTDKKMYYLANLTINFTYIPLLCQQYLAYIKTFLSMSKKCLVLDLDNTLWGGVVGEDGVNNIRLGLHYEGKVFYEFQKYIFALRERGVILAINSKNNVEDVKEVFEKHPYMVLKESHFASIKINWNDKVSNMKEIAKELNIGLDSMVFMDDDQTNCEAMKTLLPEVRTVLLPRDTSLYVSVLQSLNEFNILEMTEEDIKRNEMYTEQKQREQLKVSIGDYEAYLKSLNTQLTFYPCEKENIQRIAQLTQKTNQFNLTTKRYFVEALEGLIEKGYFIYCVRVTDKFGDNGICGVVIFSIVEKVAMIDTFLLSCRVLGRYIENDILKFIMNLAYEKEATEIVGLFQPTAKNGLVKKFYKENKFELLKVEHNTEFWNFTGGAK